MKRRFLLVPLLLAAWALPAPAGIFFFKKAPKPDPKVRVNELIVAVKTEKDESKRAAAAEELRDYDPKAFPDIVPILIDVLMTDAKPAVRAEAAQSLGKLRPVTPEAGWALEQALEKDASMRVRLQARSSLLQYHWAGYRSPKDAMKNGPAVESKEPPLAPPLDQGPPPNPAPSPSSAPPRLTPKPADTSGRRPQPSGLKIIPTKEPPLLQPPPGSSPPPPPQQGPSLDPP
jgi:hypothetical protein